MENWQKLSFNYHQIPTLSVLVGLCPKSEIRMANSAALIGQSAKIAQACVSQYLGYYGTNKKKKKKKKKLSCLMTKSTKWHVRPAKTQISLGIRPIWSEWSAWHPPSLIRVFAVRMKKAWVLSYPLSVQRKLWSDWADAQTDLSLRWAHKPFCWFCHEAAEMN